MNELATFASKLKLVGSITLDVAELTLLVRSASDDQRKSAVSYMDAYKEQRGEIKTEDEWTRFYNGVKKRLTV